MTPPSGSTDSPRFFPAVCAAGHRPFVVKVQLPAHETHPPPCPECHGECRFIPGAYYSEAFLPTVERAIDILYAARLSAPAAREAAQVLGQSLADPSPARLRAAIDRYDGLHSLRSMLPDVITTTNIRDVRNLIGLVAALLPACAPPERSAAGGPISASEAPPSIEAPPESGLPIPSDGEPQDAGAVRSSQSA